MRSVQEWTGEPDPNSNIKYLPPTSAPKQSKAQMLVADNDRANAYLTISQVSKTFPFLSLFAVDPFSLLD
jgi:hypothetical protein